MPRTPEAQAKIDYARERICDHLVKIERVFRPDQKMKLTLLARATEHPDGSRDILITDDDLTDVRKALDVLATKEQE